MRKPRNPCPLILSILIGITCALCLLPFALVLIISFGEKTEGAAWQWALELSQYQRFFVGLEWPDSVSILYSQKLFYSFCYATIGAMLAITLAFPLT